MRILFSLFVILFLIHGVADSQKTQPSIPTTQPYGIIDTSDLKMTSCDFEKDANVMVLFDKAVVYYNYSAVKMERHKRIKILNDKGRDEANIRIEYFGANYVEEITDVEAETINLNDKSIDFTSIDKKLIYTETVDKNRKAIVFTFPNVKAGSVIEFKYKKSTQYGYNYPNWFFQSSIPCRYSEFDASFRDEYTFTFFKKVYQPMFKDTSMLTSNPKGKRYIWALANIKAFKEEPYMDYPEDYFQCILTRVQLQNRNWAKIAQFIRNDEDFGLELKKTLSKENEIIDKANLLNTEDKKIAFIFDTVRNSMKWNKLDWWYCNDGIKKAWDKKTGNSAEINLILYHFLKMANVDAYLLALRTRKYGKLEIDYPDLLQFNKTVVFCKVDSTKTYVLDATNKLNTYNTPPSDLIGLYALPVEPINKSYKLLQVKSGNTIESTSIDGSISVEGKLEGTIQISSTTYSKVKYLEKYNELGEKKYIDKIERENSGLSIRSLKLENMQNDTLPLNQFLEFKYSLTEPDGDYIYFSPNLLTDFRNNPFLNETRVSNIDFGSPYTYLINGRYKIPKGYKADVLPKSVTMSMPDKSIGFKRIIGVQDDIVLVRFLIDYKQSSFLKDQYLSLYDFYKKMYEMLNEQIVLKKL